MTGALGAGCGVPHAANDEAPLVTRTGPIDGIVFVHGINGSAADWSVMVERFKADGWPEDRLVAESFTDPEWGCNTLNAAQVSDWVHTLEGRGAQRIAVVAHSMGGLSSRFFMKSLDGNARIDAFTTLGTMHHGLTSPCLAPVRVCVWRELCSNGQFIRDLNASPSTPGPTKWTSIFSDGDQTVPTTSSTLDGATNVLAPGLQHAGPDGLQSSEKVYQLVLESLRVE